LGRTVPSYRMILEAEIKKWRSFLKALRSRDRDSFEKLMDDCRRYASASGAATRLIVTEAMFMSMLLSHQRTLEEVKATLDKFKSILHPE